MSGPDRTRAILDAMARYRDGSRRGVGGRPTLGDEPTVLLQIKVPQSMRDRMAKIDENVSAYVRAAIERALLEDESP